MESIYLAIKNVFTMRQEENESITKLTKQFTNAKDVMETQPGTLEMKKYLESLSDYAGVNNANKVSQT